jgi:hypothetical protein
MRRLAIRWTTGWRTARPAGAARPATAAAVGRHPLLEPRLKARLLVRRQDLGDVRAQSLLLGVEARPYFLLDLVEARAARFHNPIELHALIAAETEVPAEAIDELARPHPSAR